MAQSMVVDGRQATPIQYPMGSIVAYVPYYKIYDPNLRPQNTKSYEIGADLTFWNGIITLNYTYSRQNVKDQIFDVPLSTSTGRDDLVFGVSMMSLVAVPPSVPMTRATVERT